MFGEKLKLLRKVRGHNEGGDKIKDLIENSGINATISTISTWERNPYPPLQAIEKVCSHYQVPLWEFFADEDVQREFKAWREWKKENSNLSMYLSIDENTREVVDYIISQGPMSDTTKNVVMGWLKLTFKTIMDLKDGINK